MRMIDADRFGEIMEQWKKDCLADNDTRGANIISDVMLQLDDMSTLTSSNKPLTWEEFEVMIDKPVYIIELETRSYWALVHQVSDVGVRLTSAIDLHDYGSRGLYGKTWLAYRRSPEEDV